jgi:ABC-type multidrug transport system permease subunit
MPVQVPFIGGIIAAAMAALSRLVMTNAGRWITFILLAFGINLGVGAVVGNQFAAKASEAMGGIPSEIAQWMGVLRIDVYVSCVISALIIYNLRQAARVQFLAAGRR